MPPHAADPAPDPAADPAPRPANRVLYGALRLATGVALRWYYSDVESRGAERIPGAGPMIVVGNHPNALVDALVLGRMVPRRLMITAKSTLFANRFAAWFFRTCGVIPLYRASDRRAGRTAGGSRENRGSFRAVHAALRDGAAVLVFPEGKSHDEPYMAPLKTGAARMALEARDAGDVPGLKIVPMGLVFERKESPRTRVLARVGEPIAMDAWRAPEGVPAATALTTEIEARLRALTLNYSSADEAARASALTSVVAALITETPPVGAVDRPLGVDAEVARRVEELRSRIAGGDVATRMRADALVLRLEAFRQRAALLGIRVEDIGISPRWREGLRFVWREGWILLVAGPAALWGWINHIIPLRAARAVALKHVGGAADPAMNTIVAGFGLVLVAYLVQGLAVWMLAGGWWAALYLASLPVAGDVNFYLQARVERAIARARTFLRFRRQPELRRSLVAEYESLREEVLGFEQRLDDEPL